MLLVEALSIVPEERPVPGKDHQMIGKPRRGVLAGNRRRNSVPGRGREYFFSGRKRFYGL